MDSREYWEEKDRRDKAQKEENGRTALAMLLGLVFIIAVIGGISFGC